MLRLKVNVELYLPEWHLCNIPRDSTMSELTRNVCRFCVKTKTSHVCALFNKPLLRCGDEVHKDRKCVKLCCKATKNIDATSQGPLAP